MAQMITKGTVLKQTLTTTLTTVAQVVSFDHSGVSVETYDGTTLDTTGAGREKHPNGLVNGGSVSAEILWDANLAGHQAITDDITTPVERVWSLTFTDAQTTEATFNVAGITDFGITGQLDDGVRANITLELDQLMNYPT